MEMEKSPYIQAQLEKLAIHYWIGKAGRWNRYSEQKCWQVLMMYQIFGGQYDACPPFTWLIRLKSYSRSDKATVLLRPPGSLKIPIFFYVLCHCVTFVATIQKKKTFVAILLLLPTKQKSNLSRNKKIIKLVVHFVASLAFY